MLVVVRMRTVELHSSETGSQNRRERFWTAEWLAPQRAARGAGLRMSRAIPPTSTNQAKGPLRGPFPFILRSLHSQSPRGEAQDEPSNSRPRRMQPMYLAPLLQSRSRFARDFGLFFSLAAPGRRLHAMPTGIGPKIGMRPSRRGTRASTRSGRNKNTT